MPFGGMLGSTFNFVFETQLEKLQNGDRFYYLARLEGLNFLTELENNSFAELIMRNTDATHLPFDVFSVPAHTIEVGDPATFPVDADGSPLVISTVRNGAATSATDPVVIGGTGRRTTSWPAAVTTRLGRWWRRSPRWRRRRRCGDRRRWQRPHAGR